MPTLQLLTASLFLPFLPPPAVLLSAMFLGDINPRAAHLANC